MSEVRLRFAPSPTGYLHIGGARTALFNWLLARKEGGKFILRIEDTDVARSTQESVDAILEGMRWLGLDWDEGPFYQSDSFPLYREHVERLLACGKAYRCRCTPEELEEKREQAMKEGRKPKYDGTCRELAIGPGTPSAIRFKAPQEGVTAFDDLIKGRISFNNEELDDLIIQRSDGTPTYNFTVVIDDATMGITTVIRGDDHINNTPRQILLYEALGCPVPKFAHVPMILGADKTRLSKRHGATSVIAYRDMGYLPEAMVNYLVRLGWSHGDQEIFTEDEMVAAFDLGHIGRSPARFDFAKLENLNGHYIRATSDADLLAEMEKVLPHIAGGDVLAAKLSPALRAQLIAAMPGLKERAKTLVELFEASRFVWAGRPLPLTEQAAALLTPEARQTIAALLPELAPVADWSATAIEAVVRAFAERSGVKLGSVAQPLRAALTGKTTSPPIFDVLVVLGREESLARLRDQTEAVTAS